MEVANDGNSGAESAAPRPPDLTADGTQMTGLTTVQPLDAEPAFGGPSNSAGLGSIPVDFPNRMGGNLAARLWQVTIVNLERSLHEAKEECRILRNDLAAAKAAAAEHKERVAVLTERVEAFDREKRVGNICLLAGAAILGTGIDLVRGSSPGAGSALILVGVGLLLAGWFGFKRGAA